MDSSRVSPLSQGNHLFPPCWNEVACALSQCRVLGCYVVRATVSAQAPHKPTKEMIEIVAGLLDEFDGKFKDFDKWAVRIYCAMEKKRCGD